MIPVFPVFKNLEFSDKESIERYTHGLPIYSDFDFASLWSWNVKEDIRVSDLHSNLVLRFIDYITGEYFYTYIGNSKVNETAEALVQLSRLDGYGDVLHLLPAESVEDLDATRFDVRESRDHFDYIFSIERYLTYSGTKLKSRRNFLNSFKKNYPHYEVISLDLTDETVRTTVTDLYRDWQTQKGFLSLSESFAYDRFLQVAEHIDHTAIGLMLDGKLIAFHVSALPEGEYANGLFEKADISYPGVYQALMHEVAKDLLQRGRKYLNYEQDLGIEGLRQSKMAFDPILFFKKYSVSLRTT